MSKRVDLSEKPDVEYDDSGDGCVSLYWHGEGYSFSIRIADGHLIGGEAQLEPARSKFWKVELPKGLIKIDCTTLTTV